MPEKITRAEALERSVRSHIRWLEAEADLLAMRSDHNSSHEHHVQAELLKQVLNIPS